MIPFWFGVLLGSLGFAFVRWAVRGASDLTGPVEGQERLAGTLWDVASDRERELAEERERADWLAADLRAVTGGGRGVGSLAAHRAARAAEVDR